MVNSKKLFHRIAPYALAIILFIILSFIYFSPLLEGKDLPQMDNIHAKGMAKELVDFENKTGESSQWTNSMFGGMPAYQIKGGPSHNIFTYLQRFLRLNLPYSTVAIVFLYLLGFYLLLLSLNLNKWLSFAGAIAFAFASYNFIIIIAGHITKAYAIGYMAPVIAGVLLVFNKKYISGGLLAMLAMGMQISTNHVQVTYYLAITILIITLIKLIFAIKEKEIKHFLVASSVLLFSGILAIAPNITNLLTTYEYSKESIRGESEQLSSDAKTSSGLDKDYALSWSYGVDETFTILIPNFKGGESGGALTNNSETYKSIAKNYGPQQAGQAIKQLPLYWGDQPFTSGPVYFGAIVCFLFVLALFLIKGYNKWWILIATILSIMLAWGKNFPQLTDFFFYNVPFYNKFRTVSMTLVIANLVMPLLGFLALKKIFNKEIDKEKIIKSIKYSLFILGGLCLVFILMPGAIFNFSSKSDAQLPEWLISSIREDRSSLLKKDAFRSLIFISLSFGLIWLYIKEKLNPSYFLICLIAILLLDLWPIDKRYLNNSKFVNKAQANNQFPKSKADEIILRDPDINYRVLNLSSNPFTEVNTSYYHKSIGGYHGAKLRRFQDLIDKHIVNNIQAIQSSLKNSPTINSIKETLQKQRVLNMLNTKYIIYNPSAPPLPNNAAYGNAWFVNNYSLVNNATEEIESLNTIEPRYTAIIDKKFEPIIKDFNFSTDTTRKRIITQTGYKPNHLTYLSETSQSEIAVFSEIYYEQGWSAYIDGKSAGYFRADYVLRGMVVPSGKHTIEFKFEPPSYYIGQKISAASSILISLVLLAGLISLGLKRGLD